MKYLKENKWLWFIFPLVVLWWVFKDLIVDIIVKGGQEKLRETKKRDEKLKAAVAELKAQADKAMDEADRIAKEREEREKNEDEDWNKK